MHKQEPDVMSRLNCAYRECLNVAAFTYFSLSRKKKKNPKCAARVQCLEAFDQHRPGQ